MEECNMKKILALLLVLALLILTVLILVVFHCFKHSMP